MSELYVSVDVETDGPIPGPNSMLSIGAAAFRPDSEKPISRFSANLLTLDGAAADPETAVWWATQPRAWEAARRGAKDPAAVMQNFVAWVDHLEGRPVFVGYPAGFDFLFVYWYIRRFGLKSPFSFSAIDIKTYAMAVLKKPYRESVKKNMPARWFSEAPHTHVAVDDAIEQGVLFIRMLRENTSGGA